MKDFMRVAKISSFDGEITNAQCQIRGRKGVCCLSTVNNMPKENAARVAAKPSKIVLESFMRRPSLKDDAMSGMVGLVNDGILVEQSAYYRTEANLGAMFFIGDHFRKVVAGDIVILHFVDGMLMNSEELTAHPDRGSIGVADYDEMEISEMSEFGHGENTFLFCTRSFAEVMTEELLEDTLQRAIYTLDEKRNITAYDCERWLKMLREIYEEAHTGKEFTAMATSIPAKKQRPGKKRTVVWVVIAIVALLLVVFVFGALRRGPGGPGGPSGPGGPGQMPPGVSEQMPTEPAGGSGE